MNNGEDEDQSNFILKLKNIELEDNLLLEKQKYNLLQSELDSSKSTASKHLDLYKNECVILREKIRALGKYNSLLQQKDLKHQETIKSLLKRIEKVEKHHAGKKSSEPQKTNCENSKKNHNKVEKLKKYAYENAMENEENSDSDDRVDHSPEFNDSITMKSSQCKTSRKKFKSLSGSICPSTLRNENNVERTDMVYTRKRRRSATLTVPTTKRNACKDSVEASTPSVHALNDHLSTDSDTFASLPPILQTPPQHEAQLPAQPINSPDHLPTEDTCNPTGRQVIRLHQNTQMKWRMAPSSRCARLITKSFHQCITEFWPTFLKVPEANKELMWNDFKSRICSRGGSSPPYSATCVRKVWHSMCSRRYSNMMNIVKSKGAKPCWMNEKVYAAFLKYWDDPKQKQLSKKASNNRKNNIVPQCYPGSISLHEKMEQAA